MPEFQPLDEDPPSRPRTDRKPIRIPRFVAKNWMWMAIVLEILVFAAIVRALFQSTAESTKLERQSERPRRLR